MTADEITDQILYFYLAGHQINSVSFMGMGEPFANPNLFDALKILTNPSLFGLSQRRITISTIGMIPGIKRLTRDFPQVNLAFSLHSPFEKQRSELMPINRTYPLEELLAACRAYPLPERRRITFEYILIEQVNDAPAQAKELAQILQGIRCKINLIPLNPTSRSTYQPPTESAMLEFQEILANRGYSAFIRASKGADISAACGQLSGERHGFSSAENRDRNIP